MVAMCALTAGQPASLAQRAPETQPATGLPSPPPPTQSPQLPAQSPRPVHVQTAKPLPASRSSQTTAPVVPPDPGVTEKYCVACHNDRLKTAGLSLPGLAVAHVPEDAGNWEKRERK